MNFWNMNDFVNTSAGDCKLIRLDQKSNDRGDITPVSLGYGLPFSIKRIYYLYDIPGGSKRGGHAHYKLQQYLIAASGSFDVILNDGCNNKKISLNRPYFALHIVPGIWRELNNFSYGSVCLVLASEKYNEEDYIRKYEDFCNEKKC